MNSTKVHNRKVQKAGQLLELYTAWSSLRWSCWCDELNSWWSWKFIWRVGVLNIYFVSHSGSMALLGTVRSISANFIKRTLRHCSCEKSSRAEQLKTQSGMYCASMANNLANNRYSPRAPINSAHQQDLIPDALWQTVEKGWYWVLSSSGC